MVGPQTLHRLLLLVRSGSLAEAPFAVVAVRWTLQPLQGVANLLVYWNQAAREGQRGCCADAGDVLRLPRTTASSNASALDRLSGRLSSFISSSREPEN